MDDDKATRTVWNFAYGSNLHEDVRARRKLRTEAVVPAVLSGWTLAFNIRGVPLVEPSMAGIARCPGEHVHGVLLGLTPQQFAHLVYTEGEGRFYTVIDVDVRTYDDRVVRAKAFEPAPECVTRERPPSARYLELLQTGARRSGLDAEYCRRLEAQPSASIPAAGRMLGSLVMEALMWSHRTPLYGPCHDYLALLHRVEASGGVLGSSASQGLMLSPLLALGVGVSLRARIAKLRGSSGETKS